MSYAIKCSAADHSMLCLVEGSAATLKRWTKESEGRHYFDRCSASEAHRWVRSGRCHETLLWVEDGRIRRAGPDTP